MVKETCILAIDPGTEKCGIAVLNSNAVLQKKGIIPCRDIAAEVSSIFSSFNIDFVLVGYGTGRKMVEKELVKIDLKNNIIFVSEKYSTREARKRYFKENKPKGLWALIPTSLRTPPEAIDDYAAIILAEQFLKQK